MQCVGNQVMGEMSERMARGDAVRAKSERGVKEGSGRELQVTQGP
jgi:hypothetical protein